MVEILLMIELSLATSSEPTRYRFDKDIIVIGAGPGSEGCICFPSEGLQQNHVKITLHENEYWITNEANDPFVTLNSHSFWKKKLQQNDLIQVRTHVIKVLAINEDPEPLHEPQSVYTADDSSKVSPLIEEAYNLENHKQQRKQAPKKKSLQSHSRKLAKALFLMVLTGAAVFTFLFVEIYIRTASKIDREEMLAAESISDYAMALQYAKVYHIAQQKQNWIDPQFLKNNLVDLLSATSLPCGNIDGQGQFSNCPYILRFYTNRDFSKFLLIAQPDATFSEWIIPKRTLIVDSSLMEVHKTDDLKTLNRLLSYPTPLDGANGDEIKRAILQTDVIPLSSLAEQTGKQDFSPPKALSYMKPGAENLIYNAPRYHQFGETFLKKAIALSEDKFNMHELGILQSELDTLAKFHDLVFYSSDGMKRAFQGHKALQKLVIPSNYFTGYLIFSKEGKILNSRLIIDHDLPPQHEDPFEEKTIAEKDDFHRVATEEIIENEEIHLANVLRVKIEEAQEEIGPIIHNIYTILEDTIEKDSLFLPPSVKQLFDLYLLKREEMSLFLRNMIDSFKKAHPQIKELTIDHLLREYGLLDFYNSIAVEEEPIDLGQDHWTAFQSLIPNKQRIPFYLH